MEFWDFLSAMREQKRKGSIPSSQRLKDNQTWIPRYTDQEILDKYFLKYEYAHTLNAKTSDKDILDFLDDWDEDDSVE